MYPFEDPAFIENSKIEVRQQAGRIQHHASIVFWDLNNEGEDMIYWRNNSDTFAAYMAQYNAFYVDTLIPIYRDSGIQIAENFMDSSPSSGVDSFNPYKQSNISVKDIHYGDVHFYYMALDCEDDSTFGQYRFLSESGFQSEPSFSDYEPVSIQEDWGQNTEFLLKRTAFNDPHELMIDQSRRHYVVPADKPGNRDYFSYYLWLT
jgi:beta-mannosidase